MSDALVRLKEHLNTLNPAERAAAEYILSNPSESSRISIHVLASNAYVSPSAVVRLCHTVGFNGFKEFRRSLLTELAAEETEQRIAATQIEKNDSIEEIITIITESNIQSLYETERLMNPKVLQKCVNLIRDSDKVIFFGLGASWLAARDAYEKLLRINKPCILNEDWHLQLLSALNSTKNDVGIVISYSGQTTEMIECMKAMKDNHTPMIAITRSVKSPVYDLADYRLYTTSNESLFRSAAMSSRISQLSIIDILYTAYANQEYDYSIKQLRKTHIKKPLSHKY